MSSDKASAPAREPKPDGRRTRHAHRRRELLEAATEYVFEHGLSELSLRPLAAALGVSHRTLLYHFKSKERLFSEILAEARNRERLLVAARATEAGRELGFVDIMRAEWERIVPEYLPYFRVYYELHGLALQDPERYETFLSGVVTEWVSIATALLEREGVPRERAEPIATFVWATSRGLLLDLLTTGDRPRAEAGFDELVAAVEALLARELAADGAPGERA